MTNRTLMLGLLVLGCLLPPSVSSAEGGVLPLGDGKISSGPQAGSVWACQSAFRGGGAHRIGEWILNNGTWNPSGKIHVQGQVSWGEHRFSVSLSGTTRSITGNGLPDHATGVFPIQPDDPAAQYDRNPNRIQNQHYEFTLPATPTVARRPSCLPMGAIGILKSGVVFFNALDAAGRDGVAHEIQDACAGHPERRGRYHYHSLSPCVPDSGNGHSDLMGYAFDGFGVFGYRGQDGRELTNSQLDACHGHVHEILWDNKRISLYHYHTTREYPYTLGCFSGTPAVSQRPQPPMFHEGQDRHPPFRRGGPPPPRPF